MASTLTMARKLQRAINSKGGKILLNTNQFYSEDVKNTVTVYVIRQAYYDEATDRTKSIELFKSTSQIQIVLYLRDLWFEMNGIPIPTDNEEWNKAKAKYNGGTQNASR